DVPGLVVVGPVGARDLHRLVTTRRAIVGLGPVAVREGGHQTVDLQAGGGGGDRDRSAPPSVHTTPVRAAAQPGVQLGDGIVQRAVEIPGAGFGSDYRPARSAGDLDALALLRLAWILLVKQFDIDSDDLAVVTPYLVQLLRDVQPVMVRHLDVAAL